MCERLPCVLLVRLPMVFSLDPPAAMFRLPVLAALAALAVTASAYTCAVPASSTSVFVNAT
jgi:hypothetical protein